ncbi:MAG: protein kinase domain-containing protein [Pirellulaceae bacterium]
MPDFDDSLGGQTLGGDNNDDRFEKSLGDEHTMGDANIEEDLLDDGIKLEDLSERYTEEGVLGKGGMGEVLLAIDTRLDRKVAIKRILGKAARSKTASQRFLTEAKSIAALNHTNIVQIYDYGRSTEGPFLIMECVQGGSLLDKCKEGPIDLEEAINIFSQLCEGLAKAHAANIIHRDIKPANVLMTEDGVPKLTDFGLAKDDAADTGMTMQGAVIGTLDFMPPEQREGAHLTDHRSDLWSLAATFYQMLTGKSPKVINITELPAKLQSVVAKSLEQSKDDRYQSALEMREAIMQAHSGKMDTSRTLGEGECPECGTLNPPNGKFCVDCSAKLQVPCLQCQHPIQIWNKACGECGAQQQPLVDEKLEELQGYHDQAEAHLQELEFENAVNAVNSMGEPKDPRLANFSAWQEEFTGRLKQSRDREYERLGKILQEALTHEEAYDYQAALRVLEQAAEPLFETKLDGVSITAQSLKDRLDKNHSRLRELEQTVRKRVQTREISGLLPLVNELLTLKPNRPQVEKLKVQLENREVKRLRNRISTAISEKRWFGVLPDIEECLEIKPDQEDLIKVKADLRKQLSGSGFPVGIDQSNPQPVATLEMLGFEARKSGEAILELSITEDKVENDWLNAKLNVTNRSAYDIHDLYVSIAVLSGKRKLGKLFDSVDHLPPGEIYTLDIETSVDRTDYDYFDLDIDGINSLTIKDQNGRDQFCSLEKDAAGGAKFVNYADDSIQLKVKMAPQPESPQRDRLIAQQEKVIDEARKSGEAILEYSITEVKGEYGALEGKLTVINRSPYDIYELWVSIAVLNGKRALGDISESVTHLPPGEVHAWDFFAHLDDPNYDGFSINKELESFTEIKDQYGKKLPHDSIQMKLAFNP